MYQYFSSCDVTSREATPPHIRVLLYAPRKSLRILLEYLHRAKQRLYLVIHALERLREKVSYASSCCDADTVAGVVKSYLQVFTCNCREGDFLDSFCIEFG